MSPARLQDLLTLISAVAIAGALAFFGYRLWHAGYDVAEVEGRAALEQLRREHAEQETDRARQAEASAKAAAQKLQDEQIRNDQLAADLADAQRKHRETTDRLKGEIARVTKRYRKALDAEPEPVPACVFTAGWVRIYDEATGARMPAPANSGRAAAPAGEASPAEQLATGLGQGDVLAHHVRYAEQCRGIADQLNRLIDAVEGD